MNTLITPPPPVPDVTSTRSHYNSVVIAGVRGHHQMDRYSCGVAAAVTIWRSGGNYLTSDDWCYIKETARPCIEDGTSPKRLIRTVRGLGFTTTPILEFNRRTVSSAIAAGDLVLTTFRFPHNPPDVTHWVVIAGCSDRELLVLNCTGTPLFTKRWIAWETVMSRRSSYDTADRIKTGLADWVEDRRRNSLASRVIKNC